MDEQSEADRRAMKSAGGVMLIAMSILAMGVVGTVIAIVLFFRAAN